MKTEKQGNNETMKQKNRLLHCFIVSLFLFSFDRFAKIFFVKNPGFVWDFLLFKLNLVINKNIAFSLPLPRTLIYFLATAILLVLISLAIKNFKQNNYQFVFILNLIIIGAVSNLMDRLKYGGVIDFIDAPIFTVFNLADIYITIGVVGWLWREKN